ncbi:MAG TPA: hypothetical protein VHL79_16030 [Ramlibacter sp.]|jgi:hypothetical protein|nr:hypothetical protein [Ramlibacter sp.]
MKAKHLLLLALAAGAAGPAFAQADGQCIVAGRISDGAWAPRMAGVQLLGANGQAISRSSRDALSSVKTARLAQPTLLSECNGDKPLAQADNEPRRGKTAVPAVSRGTVDVESVSFLKLRTGGELVELRVRVPGERIVSMTR